ncbi:MAG: hypothetical protein K9L17_06385 [Clostridiales bacterium]|nr:hypothetical protein [Clostridiales bacterium]MCF8022299.1 hypothetical protein [Clostridiales bacterium]
MNKNKYTLPVDSELHSLRMKLKSSSHKTVEECQRLRVDIKKLQYAIARLNNPGRRVQKNSHKKNYHTKHKKNLNKNNTPEVIPPDLDISEYLNTKKEIAAGKENPEENSLPVPIDNKDRKRLAVYHPVNNYVFPRTLEERNNTIEERFSIVAKRMKERRSQWMENQNTKQPWWKLKLW